MCVWFCVVDKYLKWFLSLQVLSGCAIIVRGQPRGGPPPERQINLSNIRTGTLARRAAQSQPEAKDTQDEVNVSPEKTLKKCVSYNGKQVQIRTPPKKLNKCTFSVDLTIVLFLRAYLISWQYSTILSLFTFLSKLFFSLQSHENYYRNC